MHSRTVVKWDRMSRWPWLSYLEGVAVHRLHTGNSGKLNFTLPDRRDPLQMALLNVHTHLHRFIQGIVGSKPSIMDGRAQFFHQGLDLASIVVLGLVV
jgi:hypothetical protein